MAYETLTTAWTWLGWIFLLSLILVYVFGFWIAGYTPWTSTNSSGLKNPIPQWLWITFMIVLAINFLLMIIWFVVPGAIIIATKSTVTVETKNIIGTGKVVTVKKGKKGEDEDIELETLTPGGTTVQ